jgi:predicted 2-oxoglutarate/Fe(II)-dependent dioxygenase YbiX
MILEKYIKTFDNVLPLKTISSLIKFLNKQYKNKLFEDGEVGNGTHARVSKKIRNTEIYGFSQFSESLTNVHYHNLLSNINILHYEKYNQEFPFLTPCSKVNQINGLRYEKGGHYDFHVDGGGGFDRVLSSILFLNNDYKGGNLSFMDTLTSDKKIYDIPVQPGRLIMWPSNFLFPHSVRPVEEGTRFSIVSWIS